MRKLMQRRNGASPERIIEDYTAERLAEAGQSRFPIDVEGIASLLGIRRRLGEHPFAGRIYAEPSGQLVMDLNATDSDARRRFTCSHEIIHTAFPGFHHEQRYRADTTVGQYRRARSEEEYLCDLGAAFLLMPNGLLDGVYSATGGLSAVERLAEDADVSLEAAGNRLTEIASHPTVFVVLEMSHKPADRPALRRGKRVEQRLRVKYARTGKLDLYVPRFKSADDSSVFLEALATDSILEGVGTLPGVPISSGVFAIEAKAYPRRSQGQRVDRVLALARSLL